MDNKLRSQIEEKIAEWREKAERWHRDTYGGTCSADGVDWCVKELESLLTRAPTAPASVGEELRSRLDAIYDAVKWPEPRTYAIAQCSLPEEGKAPLFDKLVPLIAESVERARRGARVDIVENHFPWYDRQDAETYCVCKDSGNTPWEDHIRALAAAPPEGTK